MLAPHFSLDQVVVDIWRNVARAAEGRAMLMKSTTVNRSSRSVAQRRDLGTLASNLESVRQSLAEASQALSAYVDREIRAANATSDAVEAVDVAFSLLLSFQELTLRVETFTRLIEVNVRPNPSHRNSR